MYSYALIPPLNDGILIQADLFKGTGENQSEFFVLTFVLERAFGAQCTLEEQLRLCIMIPSEVIRELIPAQIK